MGNYYNEYKLFVISNDIDLNKVDSLEKNTFILKLNDTNSYIGELYISDSNGKLHKLQLSNEIIK